MTIELPDQPDSLPAFLEIPVRPRCRDHPITNVLLLLAIIFCIFLVYFMFS